jgi:tryptophanyl-tRNA synthetase
MKSILVSGIQPTGRLHIGNYLGALKNFVELQNSGTYQCYYFIADLHSLTEEFDPKEKYKQILELAADFIAVGIDPKQSVLFRQSLIPAHSELAWILNTITPMGELERMTQYKEKARFGKNKMDVLMEMADKKAKKKTPVREGQFKIVTTEVTEEEYQQVRNVGLFDYPVLMAADILLYDANFVPVGDDQLQHLELTRTVARKFNARFGETFIEPKALLTKTPRVMSLKDPLKKMSKSTPEGCLFLDDPPEEIKVKIARATTDSGSDIKHDEAKKPGVSNLLGIYAALSGESIQTLEREFKGKTYSEFKAKLTAVVADHFADFRKKKRALLATPYSLRTILKSGSAKAAKIANKKIAEAKEKVGLSA